MIKIVLIFSFFLESLLSNYIPIETKFFSPLFTLLSLIIIYPYFYNKENKYFMIAFCLGLLYDIVYTNTIGFNAFIFIIIAFLIKKMNIWISNNVVNVAFMSMIVITFYRIITYIFLTVIKYMEFDFENLLKSITSSIIINIIYVIITYLITDYISRNKHIPKID